jgi:hypothetical protein
MFEYNDDIYNEGLKIIEYKIHEISDESSTDFEHLALTRNNSNDSMNPLRKALRKPYDLNKLIYF